MVCRPIPGGNALSIETAARRVSPQGASLLGMVDGKFAVARRKPVFAGGAVALTTSMPRDGAPRCCPTGQGRWHIDLTMLQPTMLQPTGRSAVH